MSYESQEEAENKIKLMRNFWKILALCGGSCLFTVMLSIITGMISGWIVLKIFLYAIVLVAAIFSIITLVTTGITIYFMVTTLSEERFRKAVKEIAKEIANP